MNQVKIIASHVHLGAIVIRVMIIAARLWNFARWVMFVKRVLILSFVLLELSPMELASHNKASVWHASSLIGALKVLFVVFALRGIYAAMDVPVQLLKLPCLEIVGLAPSTSTALKKLRNRQNVSNAILQAVMLMVM